MVPKPSKDLAVRFIQSILPEYDEMLQHIERSGGYCGDVDAFVLAVQIARTVLTRLPYFPTKQERAHRELDQDFLDKLTYRLKNPPLRGKTRYRAVVPEVLC